jgi:hypothetical protein
MIYTECDDLELWNGYRVSAIDGTVLEIPNTELLRKEFGCNKNQSGEVARVKASCVFDVLNKIVIQSNIGRHDVGERVTAKEFKSPYRNSQR